MGLFSFLRKSEKSAPAEKPKQQESLSDYSGLRVEVETSEGEFLFAAKLGVGSGGSAELQRIIVKDDSAPAPPKPEDKAEAAPEEEGPTEENPLHVLLRGFDEHQKKAIHLEGDASRFAGNVWRVRNLRLRGKDNDRAFFRQDLDSGGTVMPVGKVGRTTPVDCVVINISAGGVCVQTEAEFAMGDRLMLRSRLVQNNEMTLLCSVRRISPRKSGVYEYGCRFENLDSAQEDQIARAIAQLQMQRMRR